jgi:hypothetical protein
VKERIEKMAKRAEFKLQRLIGLDKHQWKGWYGRVVAQLTGGILLEGFEKWH